MKCFKPCKISVCKLVFQTYASHVKEQKKNLRSKESIKFEGHTSAIHSDNVSTAALDPGCHLGLLFHCAMNHQCYAIILHFTTSEDFLSHTQRVKFWKMWNGANAQGKYNTISTSTVARHLWSRQNTKNTVLVFCACRNHFMQVKLYSMFILSCKVVRVCLLNEGWIHPGYQLSSPFPAPSIHPSTLCCATSVNTTVHSVVWAISFLQIHFSRLNWMWITIMLCSSISKPKMCWYSFFSVNV